MKSLVVATFAALLVVLGAPAHGLAQTYVAPYPQSGSTYAYNVSQSTYAVVPVEFTLYLPNNYPVQPNLMLMNLYEQGPTQVVEAPTSYFTPNTSVPLTQVSQDSYGNTLYTFQANVHVSIGYPKMFFECTFLDVITGEFVTVPALGGTPYIATSSTFGVSEYALWGLSSGGFSY